MKIKTLMVCEKPTQFKLISEKQEFINLLETREITIHFAHTVVPLFNFKYEQKNIKYKELPLINEINYKFNNKNLVENLIIELPNQKDSILKSKFSNSYKNLTPDFFEQFEDIIIATDNDSSGCYNAWNEIYLTMKKELDVLFKNVYFLDTDFIYNDDIMNQNIIKLFNDNDYINNRIILFNKFKEKGFLKKYFEYNYQLNSNILIKELYQNIFNNKDEELYSKFGFTKYMISCCFLLKKEERKDFHYSVILKQMFEKKFGSPTSTNYILENLFKLNIINFNEIEKKHYVTEKGKLFINSLNKKLYDPFLPNRIRDWQEEYLIEKTQTLEKINIYIKEIFLKQKRKNQYIKI